MAVTINGTTGVAGVDGSASTPAVQGSDTNTGVSFGTDIVNINTGGSTRATVDSSGRVGIGVTDVSNYWEGGDQLVIKDTGTGGCGITIHADTDDESGIFFADGTTGNAKYEGYFQYYHSDNSMRFATSAVEHMRITSGGKFCVSVDGGTDIAKQGAADTHSGLTAAAGGELQVCTTSQTTCFFNRNGSGGNIVDYRYGGSSVGNISNTGNSLPSDRNYKKNITNLSLGLDLVNKLQPVSYQYKFSDDSEPLMYGLVAQDFETALNDAGVAQNKAAILQYEEKNDEKQSDYNLDYTKLTPILINAVKELSAEVTTLKTKVAALEAA